MHEEPFTIIIIIIIISISISISIIIVITSHPFVVFLLLTLCMYLFAGIRLSCLQEFSVLSLFYRSLQVRVEGR